MLLPSAGEPYTESLIHIRVYGLPRLADLSIRILSTMSFAQEPVETCRRSILRDCRTAGRSMGRVCMDFGVSVKNDVSLYDLTLHRENADHDANRLYSRLAWRDAEAVCMPSLHNRRIFCDVHWD